MYMTWQLHAKNVTVRNRLYLADALGCSHRPVLGCTETACELRIIYPSSSCFVLQYSDHPRSLNSNPAGWLPGSNSIPTSTYIQSLKLNFKTLDLEQGLDNSFVVPCVCQRSSIGSQFPWRATCACNATDIVSCHASWWRYQLKSSKSVIIVFGESPCSIAIAWSNRQWLLSGQLATGRSWQASSTWYSTIHKQINGTHVSLASDLCKTWIWPAH